jgi:hypothetical protein
MIRKILFLASNPTDTGRLRLDKEVREVEEGLKRSNERDRFDLIPKFAVRVDDLRRSLLEHSPRIVHFSGHGTGVDGIVVENDQGEASEVPTDALARLFELCTGHIECVVLNACYSDTQADAIANHIPYVVGMKAAVSDDAAVAFAVGFYDALGVGKSIEEAFEFGRNAIALKGIPEHLTPVLRKKELNTTERQRLEAGYSPAQGVFLDVSVMKDDASSWNRGEDTILRYSVDKNDHRIRVESNLGYVALFNAGGPIAPMNYISPSWCPFKWDFPTLDFKVLNTRRTPLFLTQVEFSIDESRTDLNPLLTIKKDTQQRNAGALLLVNEGWCDLADLTVSFHLLPGKVEPPTDFDPPFEHSIAIPLLADHCELDVTGALQNEGVDVDGQMLLGDGEWESKDVFIAPRADGSKERMTAAELQQRWRKCLGRFQEEVGTLAGEICFTGANDAGRKRKVKFHALVYLANRNRMGIMKPPTFAYDTAFETENSHYERRVQISHTLQSGEADRFTIRVAVAKSSFHRFRVTLHEISGLALHSLPIEMNCFVPRSRQRIVEQVISRPPRE